MRIQLTLLLLLLGTSILAQQGRPRSGGASVEVSGKIVDLDTQAPLEFATIAFIDDNGQITTGGISGADGTYTIEVPTGVYTVQFEFISYKTQQLQQQAITKKMTLPTMGLSLDTESLDEVVVRAETTEVQIRLDKKVYNIGKDLTTSGATVTDALNNVPSVTVDVDGTINLRGNENVRILINGKPSAIAGFGSTEALQQLPAEAIEKVEVITSPSARYDAEGTAGILNIILRKEKTRGFNGSVQSFVGFPWTAGVTANVNLRTNKFNLFNTTGVRYNESPGNAFFDNRFTSPNVENPIVQETRDYDRLRKGFNTNLGIEYFLTETSSVTAAAFYRISDNETTTTNDTDELTGAGALAVSRSRIEEELEDDSNLQLS
ncbi:MAG: TonB-dependent receptor, partial [Bacteroidota bacterium]